MLKTIQRLPIYFTQGLFFDSATTLIESTGLYGSSRIQRISAATGEPLLSRDLNASYFGEGCAMVNNKTYQLTWQERKCFVYDTNLTLIDIKEIMPEIKEGWGATSDSKYLYISEGSSNIHVVEPNEWIHIRSFKVERLNGDEVSDINALQYVDGYIYANVFMSNEIIKFDARVGIVIKSYDMRNLARINQEGYSKLSPGLNFQYNPYNDVLNGIAYNEATKKFYVTGKHWNYIFEVEFS